MICNFKVFGNVNCIGNSIVFFDVGVVCNVGIISDCGIFFDFDIVCDLDLVIEYDVVINQGVLDCFMVYCGICVYFYIVIDGDIVKLSNFYLVILFIGKFEFIGVNYYVIVKLVVVIDMDVMIKGYVCVEYIIVFDF